MFKLCHSALVLVVLCCVSLPVRAEPPQILASIRPLALLVQDLAGDYAQAATLVSANADPHNFSLRVSDLRRISDADLVVWLGPDFERFLERGLSNKLPEQHLRLTDLNGLTWPEQDDHGHSHEHHDHGHDHHHHDQDPHIWLNPHNAAVIAQAVHQRLLALLPHAEEALQARLNNVLSELKALDQDIQRQLAPYRERGFGVHHNAYGHYVAAYDLNQLGHTNNLPEERLSARQLQRLNRQLQGAHCFLAEDGGHGVQRLAQVFKLPLVVADPLATNPALSSYSAFMRELTDQVEQCLRGAGEEGAG